MNLRSLQHILTAQMISSVHEGELCRSLRYLAEFTELTEAEVNNLPDEARSFVLAAIPNEEAGNAFQWHRLADAQQLRSTPVKYCFSAVAALPLPVWPFYLLGEFDPGAHLECYVSAYFPTVQAEFLERNLHLSRDSQRLTVKLPLDERIVSARFADAQEASFSYYVEGVGAVSISTKSSWSDSQNLSSPESEETKFLPLSDLQYDGPVLASKLVRSFSGVTLQAHTYFDERGAHIRDITHRRLIDFIESLGTLNTAQNPATLISHFCTMPDGSLGMEA
ncbi:hypothetical protein N9U42_02160 [Luminiphilus sp.]|nr:hypothetical protein [Luminiphilus sp.]MDA9711152.1 hypothetical protein [Luminiphilus sp.]